MPAAWPDPPAYAAVVLAGGHSRRMGTAKAALPHPVSGKPLLQHQLDVLASLLPARRLVSARSRQPLPPLPPDVTRLDDDGTRGPLAGLHTARAATPTTDLLMVIPVDLPFLPPEILRQLLTRASPTNGTFAQSPSGPEPLVCVVPRNLLPAMTTALQSRELSVRQLWSRVGTDRMTPVPFADPHPFQNWNRPNDI